MLKLKRDFFDLGVNISLDNESHVETIVLLSKLDSIRHISVEFSIEEMDITCADSKATYEQIQNYVADQRTSQRRSCERNAG